METISTIAEIIKRAGGPGAIESASDGDVKTAAVYKWPKIGIPDRHWPLVIRLSGATADELLHANVLARSKAPALSPDVEPVSFPNKAAEAPAS